MTQPLTGRFTALLAERGLLEGPGLALLAVSGGADSMALLDLCAAVRVARRLDLLVVHADHGIHRRSGEVAGTVSSTARERYGLETVVARLGLGPDAGETEARRVRYEFFRQVQQERGARWLVTAHHADDQAETVLLRLLRGSAGAGLAAMGATGPRGLTRPLLEFRRSDLAAHAHSAGLPVFDDPANADPRHARSWLRTAILPLLHDRLGEAAHDSLLSVARHAATELAAWNAALDVLPALELRWSEGRCDVARSALAGYDSVLAARLLRAAARRAGLTLFPSDADRIVAFAPKAASGRVLQLGEGLTATAAFDRLVITGATEAPAAASLSGEAGEQSFGRFQLSWHREPAPDVLQRQGWTTWLAPGRLEVRSPERGDRMIPLGGVGHRSVSRLLMEGRVPRGDRAGWPVVVRDGEPIWIPGVCRGQPAVPAPGTLAVRMDIAPTG